MKKFIILFFYLIKIVISADTICNSNLTPTTKSDCNKLNTPSEFCCFLRNLDSQNKTSSDGKNTNLNKCLPYSHLTFSGVRTITIDKILFSIDCGDSPGVPDCGNQNSPSNYNDCNRLSIETNSCCYYEYSDITGCYWFGRKMKASTNQNGLSIYCIESFFKTSFVIWLIIVLNFI
jgi:hypothetical protein